MSYPTSQMRSRMARHGRGLNHSPYPPSLPPGMVTIAGSGRGCWAGTRWWSSGQGHARVAAPQAELRPLRVQAPRRLRSERSGRFGSCEVQVRRIRKVTWAGRFNPALTGVSAERRRLGGVGAFFDPLPGLSRKLSVVARPRRRCSKVLFGTRLVHAEHFLIRVIWQLKVRSKAKIQRFSFWALLSVRGVTKSSNSPRLLVNV